MEKVKAFVIKYQLWFKLAAIALLVATIFTPYILINEYSLGTNGMYKQCAITIFQTVINMRVGIEQKYFITANEYGTCPAQPILGIISFILLLITIIFLFICIRKTKFIFVPLIFFIFTFIINFVFFIYSFSCYNTFILRERGIIAPHVAFFFTVILFITDIICLICYRKKRSPIPNTKERIEELEKRIEELENRKDG